MNGVDEQARVVSLRAPHDVRPLSEVPRIGPWHGLEAGCNAERRGDVAQRCEVLDETRLVRIVARDQCIPRAQARRRFQHRQEIAHARLGLEAQDLDVEDVDARIGKARERVADDGRVADRFVRRLVRRGGNQAQADVRVARVACASHHLRRRQLENGERRKREDACHAFTGAR